MLKALHLAEGATFAGIETHLLALAKAFPPCGVRMSTATFSEGELSRRLSALGVENHVFRRAHKFDARPVAALASFLQDGFQILHTHGYLADVYGARAARAAGVPHIATVHGHPEPFRGFAGLKMRLYMALDRRALSRAARVIAVSQPLADDLKNSGIDARLLRVVENGLPDSTATEASVKEIRRRARAAEDGLVFGFAGRFDPVKAPERFIEIAFILLEKIPSARFLLAGDGPLLKECRGRVDSSGKGSSFHFLGFADDIDAMIGACDFVIIPSDSEGVPQILLAAMRDGTVPICSAVGGIPNVLDGFPECLANPAVEELARKALAAAAPNARENPAARLKRRFAERYTAEAMAANVSRLYREVLGR